jgi:hypothetical protein
VLVVLQIIKVHPPEFGGIEVTRRQIRGSDIRVSAIPRIVPIPRSKVVGGLLFAASTAGRQESHEGESCKKW